MSNQSTTQQIFDKYGELASAKEVFYDWMGGNVWLFKHINAIRGDFYDLLMLLITRLGDRHLFFECLGAIAAVFLLWGLARRFMHKAGNKQYFVQRVCVLFLLLVGFGVNTVVIYAIKNYAALPRPYIALKTISAPAPEPGSHGVPVTQPESVKVNVLEVLAPEKDYESFPSGHVAFISMMVLSLWGVLNHTGRVIGGWLIVLVAWSRVSLGVHFPADALWAFVITFFVISLVRWALYKFFRSVLRIQC